MVKRFPVFECPTQVWNDDGATHKCGNTHGFIYKSGVYTQIDGPSAQNGTQVLGINNSGQLSLSYTDSIFNKAYRWTPDGVGGYTKESLSLASFGTFAQGINNNGDVVGFYQTPNYGGFLWRSNGSTSTFNEPNDLLTTQAIGINDNGLIVGAAYNTSQIAGYLLKNGTFSVLNPPGSTYTYTTGINNNGTIVGWYFGATGNTHGFILSETNTPEPASAGMLVAGCLGMIWRMTRRRSGLKVAS